MRSGGGPVEQVEEEKCASVAQQLSDAASLLRRAPHGHVWNSIAHLQHRSTLLRQLRLDSSLRRVVRCAYSLRGHVAEVGMTAISVASAISLTTSTMSWFALNTRSCRSAPFPLARISWITSSSRSEPNSRA